MRWGRFSRWRALAWLGVPCVVATGLWLAQARAQHLGELQSWVVARDSNAGRYVVDAVTLQTTAQRTLSCLLRRPARPSASRLPAFLVAGGIRTGRRAVFAVDTSFAGIALACDYAWRDPARLSWPLFMLRLPRSRGEVVATPRALGIAGRYLRGRPDVDTSRVVALGASLGVPPVAAWAARDPAPRAIALLYGGADLGAILESNMEDRIPTAWLRHAAAELLGWVLEPLEPSRSVALIAPRPLLVVASADDARIPVRSTQLLYDAAREPKRLVWMGGGHVRPSETQLLRMLTDSVLVWARDVLPGPGWRLQ